MTRKRKLEGKQLIIAVTKDDILQGVRRDGQYCPIARSLRRRYPDSKIEVDCELIQIDDERIPVTGKIEDFIDAFDEGQPVTPTAFFVDAEA